MVTGTSNGIACNPLAMEAQNESKAHKMSRVVERYRFKKRSGVPMRNACAYVRLLVVGRTASLFFSHTIPKCVHFAAVCVCVRMRCSNGFEMVRNASKCAVMQVRRERFVPRRSHGYSGALKTLFKLVAMVDKTLA